MTVESLFGFHRKRVRHSMELCLLWRTGTQLHFHARENATMSLQTGPAEVPGPPRASRAHAAQPGPGGQFHLQRTFFFFFLAPRSQAVLIPSKAHSFHLFSSVAPTPVNSCLNMRGSLIRSVSISLADICWKGRQARFREGTRRKGGAGLAEDALSQ